MRKIVIVTFAIIVAGVCIHCSKPTKAPAKKRDTVGSQVPSPDVTQKPKKRDLVSEAREKLDDPLRSPKAIAAAIAEARKLDGVWAKSQPGDKEAQQAGFLAVRFRLLATAASAALRTGPAARALGGDGAQARQLSLANKGLQALKKAGFSHQHFERVSLAVRACIGVNPDIKKVTFDTQKALKLALTTTTEGLALRALWLDRLEQAMTTLRKEGLHNRFFLFSRKAGRMLCRGCSDAHHVTPNMVTSNLLMAKNKAGFICDAAFVEKDRNRSHTDQLRALSRCRDEFGFSTGMEPAMYWGANLLALGVWRTAERLVEGELKASPVTRAVEKRRDAVAALLTAPLVLPTPAIVSVLPVDDARTDLTRPAAMTGLGFSGQLSRRDALGIFTVGPQDIRVGMRPVATLDKGRFTSQSNKVGYPAGGQKVMTMLELKEAALTAENRAVEPVVAAGQRLIHVLGKTKGLTPKPARHIKGDAIIDLIVDALAPSWAVERVIDSLVVGGFKHFRFVKTDVSGQALPLLVRSAPKKVTDSLNLPYTRPMIAVVTDEVVDIWRPANLVGKRGPKDVAYKRPEGAAPGYRGKVLTRLRVLIPEGSGGGVGARTLKIVQKAMLYMRYQSGAGPLIYVVAGKGALAADVLRVARVFQEIRGVRLEGTETIWPETQCAGEGNVANRRESKGCPTGVAVAFSKSAVPSSRGIVSKIAKRSVSKNEPKPEKPQPAAHQGCDKKSIRASMRRRASGFRFCYEKELRMNTTLKGRVVMRFTIGANGTLLGAPVVSSSTLKHKGVHKCLIRNINRVKFAKPDGSRCTVRWPFKFKPR